MFDNIYYDEEIFDGEEDLGVMCCFCNKSMKVVDVNPLDVNILINHDKGKDVQYTQDFFCHNNCFKKKLHNENHSKIGYVCCFCNKEITSTNLDPAHIQLSVFTNKRYVQDSPGFFCHTFCFKDALHDKIRIHFFLPSIVGD